MMDEVEYLKVGEVDEDVVEQLATSIRRGDRVESEHLLDRLFADSGTITHRIQLGRFKPQARAAA